MMTIDEFNSLSIGRRIIQWCRDYGLDSDFVKCRAVQFAPDHPVTKRLQARWARGA